MPPSLSKPPLALSERSPVDAAKQIGVRRTSSTQPLTNAICLRRRPTFRFNLFERNAISGEFRQHFIYS